MKIHFISTLLSKQTKVNFIMKKSLLLFIALLLLTSTAYGQKRNKKKKAKENESSIFVSSLLNIDSEEFNITQIREEFVEVNGMDTLINTANISYTIPRNNFSLGLSFKILKNSTYQEISLTKFSYTKRDNLSTNTALGSTVLVNGFSNNVWDIQARYEFGNYFLANKNTRINIGVAIATEPSFIYSSIDPVVSNQFPLKTSRTRLHLTLIPVASFKITNNFSLGIKVIPNIFNIDWNRSRIEDPTLTPRQRVSNDFETTFFNNNLATNIIARFRIQSGDGKKKRSKR